jgi:hypothetical protein
MKKLAITAGAIIFLTIPALAAPSDKPLVVAEDAAVSVHVGDKDNHDRDRHHVVVVHKHHDEDRDRHHVVVVHHKDRDRHDETDKH